MYYNGQPTEIILYQGLTRLALGERGPRARLYRLLDYGEQRLGDEMRIEHFAVSLPDFPIFNKGYTEISCAHC